VGSKNQEYKGRNCIDEKISFHEIADFAHAPRMPFQRLFGCAEALSGDLIISGHCEEI
jgi:hypothetical protein